MLKDQLDQKIKAIGLSFDSEAGASRQNIDLSRNHPTIKSNSRQSLNNSGPGSGSLNRSRQTIAKNNSSTRQIDGLLQISSLQKACEDLKIENDLLKAKTEQHSKNLESALKEQKEAF